MQGAEAPHIFLSLYRAINHEFQIMNQCNHYYAVAANRNPPAPITATEPSPILRATPEHTQKLPLNTRAI